MPKRREHWVVEWTDLLGSRSTLARPTRECAAHFIEGLRADFARVAPTHNPNPFTERRPGPCPWG